MSACTAMTESNSYRTSFLLLRLCIVFFIAAFIGGCPFGEFPHSTAIIHVSTPSPQSIYSQLGHYLLSTGLVRGSGEIPAPATVTKRSWYAIRKNYSRYSYYQFGVALLLDNDGISIEILEFDYSPGNKDFTTFSSNGCERIKDIVAKVKDLVGAQKISIERDYSCQQRQVS